MLQTSIHPPNQPPPPIPGKRHFFYRLLRVCSTMLCVHLLLRTFQCYGSHLGICWSAGTLSIPVHWGHPQHVETHLACSMGTLIAPLTIWPVITILLTAPNARLPGGTSGGLKTPSGPAVVTKGATNYQVKGWSYKDARDASSILKEWKHFNNYFTSRWNIANKKWDCHLIYVKLLPLWLGWSCMTAVVLVSAVFPQFLLTQQSHSL